MSGEVVKFDPSKFAAAVKNMAKGASARVGFLKMDKTGQWCWGTDETPVDEETPVYIDPMGFVHGWQCWADTDLPGVQSELLGEVLAPMYEAMPPKPPQVPENGRGWNELRGLSCVVDGQKLVYSTTSVGGVNAIAALAEDYAKQYQKAPSKMIAVANLSSDSYKHKNKTYGRIYVPIIKVVGWASSLPELVEATADKVIEKAKGTPAKKAAPAAKQAAVKPAAKTAAKPARRAA